jgi:thiol:disulfide interchange protein DsbD
MNRRSLPLPRALQTLLVLLAVASSALAAAPSPGAGGQFGLEQLGGGSQRARAELFARRDGELVRVAIRVAIDRGWHLYHSELGDPNAIGLPTEVELAGEGVAWSAVRFPEPHALPQPEFDATILSHEGTIVLYAAGRVAGGEAGPITASIVGQTCDDKTCVPYEETLAERGTGPDELFAKFPDELLASPSATTTGAQTVEGPPDEHGGGEADATLYARRSGREVDVALEIAIAPGWHLYHSELGHPDAVGKPTKIQLAADGVVFGPPTFPAPKQVPQPDWDAWINAHAGTIVVRAQGELAQGVDASGPVSARLDGLTCQDGEGGVCIPYRETTFERGRGSDALFALAAASVGEAQGADGVVELAGENSGLLGFLGLAVFWGIVTLLMPCTYPMIPITISFFTKQAAERKGGALPLALAYGLGIVLVFVVIGVVFGSLIIDFAVHPVTNLVIGILFVYFALALFGVVNLQPPRFLLELASKASQKGGLLGVFLMGTTLVITSFTCTAPFVGTLLAAGAQDAGRDVGRIALGMGVFGATMAVPFVALALVPTALKSMPKSGEWMNTFKVFMGYVEIAGALKFFSNADLVWKWNVFSRELFLLAWVVLFAAAGVYLLGLVPRSPTRPGPRRLASALAVLAFAGYCAWGMKGGELDRVMTAIVPNYSGGRLMPKWTNFEIAWSISVDDFDGAVARARNEQKLVLVNFTGHT